MFRTGIGYDIHPLVANRPLVLGGVEVPFPKGLAGHSDGDVALHAICDSLLGAMGRGDLGEHFPDRDPAYAGIASRRLLEDVAAQVTAQGYRIASIDTTIIAEAPRLDGFRETMREAIARAAGIDPGRVNIKATTHEGLGALGHQEAIASLAVSLLEAVPSRSRSAAPKRRSSARPARRVRGTRTRTGRPTGT